MSIAAAVSRLPKKQAPQVEDARMTLVEHLRELRSRVFKALLAIVTISGLALFAFYNALSNFIIRPYCDVSSKHRVEFLNNGCALTAHAPLDAFSYRIKISIFAGIVLSAPFWLYQLWAFITPGLHAKERKYSLIFVSISSVLFAMGATLAWVLLPTTLDALLGFGGDGVITQLTSDEYLTFIFKLVAIFGVGFEFPLLLMAANFAGVLSSEKMRSFRRIAIFGCVIFAGVATPSTDPFTMLGLALPLIVLFELSVIVARIHDRRMRKRNANSPYSELGDDEISPLGLEDHEEDLAGTGGHSSGANVSHGSSSYTDAT